MRTITIARHGDDGKIFVHNTRNVFDHPIHTVYFDSLFQVVRQI